jgi:hypothetical protein
LRLPWYDLALWAAGPAVNAALLVVLLLRRRLRQFSSLALWSAFSIAGSAVLFAAYGAGTRLYERLYWTIEGIDFLLQLLIVAQVAWLGFEPLGAELRTRLKSLLPAGAAFFAIALGLAALIHPAATSPRGQLEVRAQLFTSILICCVFSYVLSLSERRGLHWRSHVMAVGSGLTAWALLSLVIDLLHAWMGRTEHFLALEHLRMVAYLCIFLYWIAALWRDEPPLPALSPGTRNSILHTTERLRYDAAQVLDRTGLRRERD